MGMTSYFSHEDIIVKDSKGLKAFIKRWKKEFEDDDSYELDIDNMISKNYKALTFEVWNDWRIISYWYEPMVVFLNCVAKYIQGNVRFNFETDEEMADITFDNGKCTINIGTMEFVPWSPSNY